MYKKISNRSIQIKASSYWFLCFLLPLNFMAQTTYENQSDVLVELFKEWRTFEAPPLIDGVPDYSQESFDARQAGYTVLREKLEGLPKEKWSVEAQVDWQLLWAEMNGYQFNYKVLKPWQRDPAFYKAIWTSKSDVPAHEGPTSHFVIELWQYNFPLNQKRRNDLISSLKMIPELNNQAQFNLTGNAKDLWIAGIRDIQDQVEVLKDILLKPDVNGDRILVSEINKAIASTQYFVNWLKEEAPKKNGPSGIGKENYTWYQQNVHLVPLSWDDEVLLLKRELARAWSSLKLEEHRNRNLVEINPADSPEAYAILAQNAAKELINFLDQNDIVTVKDY